MASGSVAQYPSIASLGVSDCSAVDYLLVFGPHG